MFSLEVLDDFCASVFFGKLVFRNHKPLCPVAKSVVRKTLVEDNHIREILNNLNILKPMKPDRKHPQVLWELTDVMWRQSEEIIEDWKKVNITPIFKRDKRKDPGIYRLINLTSTTGMVMDHLILENISRNMKHKKIIRSSQHGFMKQKLWLTNLISFNNEETSLVAEGGAVGVDYLTLIREAFDIPVTSSQPR